MNIDIIDKTNRLTNDDIKLLKNILRFAYKKEKIKNDIEVSLTIVTNEEIKKLNKQYRNIDEPTDVLSFEMYDPYVELEDEFKQIPIPIGDIIISIDKVEEQAKRYNHSFERELAFLTVHGFLHLLGYTHDDVEEEKIMFSRQEQILKEFQLER